MFVRVCTDYADLIGALRDRTVEMQISRASIDDIAGLSDGYSAKLLAAEPSKILGPMSMGPTLETLGLRLMLVEDTAATARTTRLRTPVISSHQRFGNKSNSKPPVTIAAPEPDCTYAAHGPVSRAAAPTGSRSHLRVVQTKSGRRFG